MAPTKPPLFRIERTRMPLLTDIDFTSPSTFTFTGCSEKKFTCTLATITTLYFPPTLAWIYVVKPSFLQPCAKHALPSAYYLVLPVLLCKGKGMFDRITVLFVGDMRLLELWSSSVSSIFEAAVKLIFQFVSNEADSAFVSIAVSHFRLSDSCRSQRFTKINRICESPAC